MLRWTTIAVTVWLVMGSSARADEYEAATVQQCGKYKAKGGEFLFITLTVKGKKDPVHFNVDNLKVVDEAGRVVPEQRYMQVLKKGVIVDVITEHEPAPSAPNASDGEPQETWEVIREIKIRKLRV